jgi:hypothetical protein
MLDPDRVKKAIFLTGPAGDCPSLTANGIDPSAHALHSVTEEKLIPSIMDKLSDTPLPHGLHRSSYESAPIRPETWQNLPSVLMLGRPDGFDSEAIVRMARQSDKDLIGIMLPLPGSEYPSEQSKKFVDLLWEFVHDERLVLMFFESYDQILIRTRFLLAASDRLGSYAASLPSRPLTWEQLFEPDPMPKAICAFLAQLQEIAREGGYHCRTIK